MNPQNPASELAEILAKKIPFDAVAEALFRGLTATTVSRSGAIEQDSRAVRLDVGFMRGMCSNGMIFTAEAVKILASHTDGGIRHLKLSHPFDGMAALVKQFGETVADVRAVDVTPEEGAEIARRVIGWPALTDKATPRQCEDQQMLDADLVARRDRYFGDLGANAYAAFNLVTDFASHPPESHRMRRDRPTLERMAGAWLWRFRIAAKKPGFTVARHIEELGQVGVPMAGKGPHFPQTI